MNHEREKVSHGSRYPPPAPPGGGRTTPARIPQARRLAWGLGIESIIMASQPTVLCIDDESHILYVVSLKLRGGGFKVITATNGKEGLAAALEHAPDLILTDYQMPLLDGLSLCRELAKHERTRRIPAVILTARGFSITPEQLADTNVSAVLTKPFSPREVLARARALTTGHHHAVAVAGETL